MEGGDVCLGFRLCSTVAAAEKKQGQELGNSGLEFGLSLVNLIIWNTCFNLYEPKQQGLNCINSMEHSVQHGGHSKSRESHVEGALEPLLRVGTIPCFSPLRTVSPSHSSLSEPLSSHPPHSKHTFFLPIQLYSSFH